MPKILREMNDKLTLEADSGNVISWWIDASYVVHPNMRSHTGATMSMGKGCSISLSTKQKINTRSSTEAEIVGVNDAMYLGLWVRHFLEAQGYNIKDNIVYQDNRSSIKLVKNRKKSSTKNTRHVEFRYFFITDNIQRNKLLVECCPTDSMLGDYYTKPQQGTRMRDSRTAILNLKQDPPLVSQECVKTCASRQPVIGHTHCTCRHVSKHDTSSNNESVSRKAKSYLIAAKGLISKVNIQVNQLYHFIQLT